MKPLRLVALPSTKQTPTVDFIRSHYRDLYKGKITAVTPRKETSLRVIVEEAPSITFCSVEYLLRVFGSTSSSRTDYGARDRFLRLLNDERLTSPRTPSDVLAQVRSIPNSGAAWVRLPEFMNSDALTRRHYVAEAGTERWNQLSRREPTLLMREGGRSPSWNIHDTGSAYSGNFILTLPGGPFNEENLELLFPGVVIINEWLPTGKGLSNNPTLTQCIAFSNKISHSAMNAIYSALSLDLNPKADVRPTLHFSSPNFVFQTTGFDIVNTPGQFVAAFAVKSTSLGTKRYTVNESSLSNALETDEKSPLYPGFSQAWYACAELLVQLAANLRAAQLTQHQFTTWDDVQSVVMRATYSSPLGVSLFSYLPVKGTYCIETLKRLKQSSHPSKFINKGYAQLTYDALMFNSSARIAPTPAIQKFMAVTTPAELLALYVSTN